jgi:hypothetical protein
MKQRALTALLALAALALFYALLFPKPIRALQPDSLPWSTDHGDDGQLAVWRWLQAEHIPVVSLRQRYDRLESNASGAAATGNLLVMVLPQRLAARAEEWPSLARWVERGNTLLVMAALDDTPRWSLGVESSMVDDLQRAAHLSFLVKTGVQAARTPANPEAVPPKPEAVPAQSQQLRDALGAMLAPTLIPIVPNGEHPLLAQVGHLEGESDLPASRWRAQAIDGAVPVTLAQREDNQDPVLWLMRQGEGQVIVCALASPFTNRQIARSDNAQLLSNVIAWSRAPQGSVMFDDAHQGLVDFYDPKAFFHDPRLHRTLWWIVLLWLAFVLGPLGLRSAFSPWQPVDETALIDASGRFYSAAVAPRAAARRLFENFFNALRRRLGLPTTGEPLWDWLAAQAVISSRERSQLQAQYARVYAGERIELARLHNLLAELRGKLA